MKTKEAQALFGEALKQYREILEDIARRNVDRHLGDVCTGDDDPETIYQEAFLLAFDGLHDAGISDETAREVANEVARSYAPDGGGQ